MSNTQDLPLEESATPTVPPETNIPATTDESATPTIPLPAAVPEAVDEPTTPTATPVAVVPETAGALVTAATPVPTSEEDASVAATTEVSTTEIPVSPAMPGALNTPPPLSVYPDYMPVDSSGLEAAPVPAPSQEPLRFSYTPPPVKPRSTLTAQAKKLGRAFAQSKKLRLISGLLLLLILLGIAVPLTIKYAPASTATITITPASKPVSHEYLIDTSQHQTIQTRHLSSTAKASKPVHASGKGHQVATVAKGTVTVTLVQGLIPINTGYLVITSSTGIKIVVDITSWTPSSGPKDCPANAEQSGAVGNIPAYSINGNYYMVDSPSVIVFAQNTQPFSGGEDAHDYMFLQQQDIDGVVNPLTDQLTTAATDAMKKQEQAGKGTTTFTCSTKIEGNKVNDRVTDGTVTVSVTCEEEEYDQQQAASVAGDLLKADAAIQLGTHYQLSGDIRTKIVIARPTATPTDDHHVQIDIQAEGIWVYQFSQQQLKQLAQSLTGKARDDALTTLQHTPGIAKVHIATSGFIGTALPWTSESIRFVVVNVPGLQAS